MSKEIFTGTRRQVEGENAEDGELLYSQEATRNLRLIAQEFNLRIERGLVEPERLSPKEQINRYLWAVKQIAPDVDQLSDNLIENRSWKVNPSMVVTMPVVGTGGQEEVQIQNTLEKLSEDPMVSQGKVALLLLVNRPANSNPDNTAKLAEEKIANLNLNAIVIETEVTDGLGFVDGPFSGVMATEENQVPIALLRDLLSISAMKMWIKNPRSAPPLLLQMDGDFEGFSRGSFQTIAEQFSDQTIDFLQCTSDWDSSVNPTSSNISLWIGSELMRELPQTIKKPLNNPLPLPVKTQLIYGEAIQRGIQVPQAERMEAIARKGGYGLNRTRHDELDQNIRMSALMNMSGVRTTDEVVFLWSNRRAVKSWNDFRQPPISQWQSAFSVQDSVRQETADNIRENSSGEDKLTAINRTLERFPVPPIIPGVYKDFTQPVSEVLQNYGIDGETGSVNVKDKPGGLKYIQLNNL
jgi:hypothetical protein